MFRLELNQGLEVRGAFQRLERPVPLRPESNIITLTGEGATARGLLESNALFISSYPGLPTMWIVDLLAPHAEERRLHLEWSVNEKVALEGAAGAAMLGVRSTCLVEDVGMNVLSDSLFQLAIAGVQAGMVIVMGTDPGVRNVPSPMDSRHYASMSGLLGLVAATPQEQKDIVVEAFKLSEESGLPVLIQLSIEVGEQRGSVRLSPLPSSVQSKLSFEKNALRRGQAGGFLSRKNRHLERQAVLKYQANRLSFNEVHSNGREKIAVLAVGPAHRYVQEAIRMLPDVEIAVIKIGVFYPLPDEVILPVLHRVEDLLVVEEQDPVVETQVRVMAQKAGRLVRIHGKDDGVLPVTGPCSTRGILYALKRLLGSADPQEPAKADGASRAREALRQMAPPAFHNNCPGCPHSSSLWALKKAMENVGGNFIVTGDNGCMVSESYDLIDARLSLGASVAFAAGMAHLEIPHTKVIAVIGDSGLFHNGVQGVINAANTGADILIYVLDNAGAAATGGQPTPNVGILASGNPTKMVAIAQLARACNVDSVQVIDPYKIPEVQKVIEEALRKPGQRMIVASRECMRMATETGRAQGRDVIPLYVDQAMCNGCTICVEDFHCSAISFANSKASIDPWLCTACGACATICPVNAIHKRKS